MMASQGGEGRRRVQGFTLVELIVVMAVIGIVASFTMPRVAAFLYADQLKLTARRLVGLINVASQLAQQRQQPLRLRYIPEKRLFVIVPGEAGDAADKEDDEEATPPDRSEMLQLAPAVQLRDVWSWYGGTKATGAQNIRFSRDGYVEPTVIHLQDGDGAEISVVLPPFLGTVQIIDSYVDAERQNVFN